MSQYLGKIGKETARERKQDNIDRKKKWGIKTVSE